MDRARTIRLIAPLAALLACEAPQKSAEGPRIVRLPDLPIARCALAEAPVQIDRGTGRFDDVLVGEELRSGDKLRTGALGFARVDFGSGGGVRLSDAAEIELRSLAANGAQRAVATVAVTFGSVLGFLDPPPPGSALRPRLYVRAISASVPVELRGVKPLQFAVTRTKDGLEISGLSGEGAVILNGKEQPVEPGRFLSVTAGELREPRELPVPPELAEPNSDDRFFCPGLVLRLSWHPASGAAGSVVQIARDPEFRSLVLAEETSLDHILFVPRQAGRFLWRAASRTAEGRVGPFGDPRPLFCEAEAPQDLLVAPHEGEVVRYFGQTPKLNFVWKSWPQAQTYRLAVAKTADLRATDAVTRSTREPTLDVDDLEEGEYYWGVWAEDQGDQPLFLAPRKLVLSRSRVKTPSTLQQWGQ
jgi:hypothetical protein